MTLTPGRTDSFDQLGVLVDEPSLTEDVGSRIFQLKNSKKIQNQKIAQYLEM
jgi:hypothetical protein